MVAAKRLQHSVGITSIKRRDYAPIVLSEQCSHDKCCLGFLCSLLIIIYIDMSNVGIFCVLKNSVMTMYFGV